MAAAVSAFRGYILDLDGTVYLGERLIPGAGEAIAALRARGARVVFLSNKPIQTREHYAAKLNRLGVPTEVADVINSSAVMVHYLGRRAPGARLFVVGEPPLVDELRRAGFEVIADPAAGPGSWRPTRTAPARWTRATSARSPTALG